MLSVLRIAARVPDTLRLQPSSRRYNQPGAVPNSNYYPIAKNMRNWRIAFRQKDSRAEAKLIAIAQELGLHGLDELRHELDFAKKFASLEKSNSILLRAHGAIVVGEVLKAIRDDLLKLRDEADKRANLSIRQMSETGKYEGKGITRGVGALFQKARILRTNSAHWGFASVDEFEKYLKDLTVSETDLKFIINAVTKHYNLKSKEDQFKYGEEEKEE